MEIVVINEFFDIKMKTRLRSSNCYLGILVLVFLLFSSCREEKSKEFSSSTNRQENLSPDELPIIKFDTLQHDFGSIKEGEQVGWYFRFRNEGHSDLIINHASASCGCTIPDFTPEPIPPGGEGSIKVVFDSKGRSGKQQKSVTVESNAQTALVTLTLEADIYSNN